VSIQAIVNYHIKSTEKQAFEFDVDGIVGNLISPNLVPTEVEVQDLRDGDIKVNFFDDGITFENHDSQISKFDDSPEWVEDYDRELTSLLKETIGAKEVIVFDHTVRVDDPNADRKPARNVHNDYSIKGANQRLLDLVGLEKASEFNNNHFGFVNIWRPVEQVIMTSPLGFIRPSSIRPEDWMTIELVYPNRIGQILGVASDQDHEWFYMSKMSPSEVAIFNIYDNKTIPSLGHSALDIVESESTQKIVRKSIESRTLIRYS
jgi:hypothetical protein